MTQWENGVIEIPMNDTFTTMLDTVGKEGWQAWGILGADIEKKVVRVAVKRVKSTIDVVGNMPSNLMKS